MSRLTRPTLAALLLLAACGGSTPEPAGPTTADTVAVDGYLVVANAGQLHLVDPSTGLTSAAGAPVVTPPNLLDAVALSPDSRRLAWVAPDTSVVVADVVLDAEGRPAFRTLRTFPPSPAVDRLRWSPDGDVVTSSGQLLDPETGAVHACHPPGTSIGLPGTVQPVVAFPGTRRFACTDTYDLWDGDVRLSTRAFPAMPSADGQWLGPGLHVPSGASRDVPYLAGFDDAWSSGARVRFPRPSAGWVAFLRGIHGKSVTSAPSGAGGWAVVYSIVDNPALPDEGVQYDPAPIFTSGDWKDDGLWPIQKGLGAWLRDHDGRYYEPVGLSADGERVVYTVESWDIVQTRGIPGEHTLETALVEIARDGTTRGFRTSGLVAEGFIPLYAEPSTAGSLSHHGLLDLGDGDWLWPSSGGWVGYLDGAPTFVERAAHLTPDARWFFDVRPPEPGDDPQVARLCFLEAPSGKGGRCMPMPLQGTPLFVMGQGTKAAHASDPPVLFGTSRWAAFPGSAVTLFGARLGDGGTVHVGDVAVPAADIVSWSDTKIVFTMTEALPTSGRITVATTGGTAGDRRALWLHRSTRTETPFDGTALGPVPAPQGLSVHELGLPDDFGKVTSPVIFGPDTRQADGRVAVYSPGATPAERVEVAVTSGPYTRLITFELEDGLADGGRWQPVLPYGGFGAVDSYPTFMTIAGALFERMSDLRFELGTRATFTGLTQRLPFGGAITLHLPDFWRPDPLSDRAYTTSRFAPNYVTPYSFLVLDGWTLGAAYGLWEPAYATSPNLALPLFFRDVEVVGDVLVFTGADPMGEAGGAYALSTDGGATLGEVTVLDPALGVDGPLREPIRVEAAAGAFFLVFEAAPNDPSVLGVHRLDPDGTFTPDVTDVPPGALIVRTAASIVPPTLTFARDGGRLLVHFPGTQSLAFVDFDAPSPAWSTAAGAVGEVVSLWHDEPSGDVYAVLTSGEVQRATRAGAWQDWAPLDLAIDLALPIRVHPVALTRLEDGRFLVLAHLFDATPGAAPTAPSPLGPSGFLLGPKP